MRAGKGAAASLGECHCARAPRCTWQRRDGGRPDDPTRARSAASVEREVRNTRVDRRLHRQTEIVVEFEDANGDGAPATVAQRSDDRCVGTPAERDVLPASGVAVASCGGAGPVQEAFDDPRVSADRATAETIMEEAAILQVVDQPVAITPTPSGFTPPRRRCPPYCRIIVRPPGQVQASPSRWATDPLWLGISSSGARTRPRRGRSRVREPAAQTEFHRPDRRRRHVRRAADSLRRSCHQPPGVRRCSHGTASSVRP